MNPLSGMRIIITGASSGIGRATAIMASDAGAKLALIARRADPLREVTAALDAWGYPADVSDPDQTRAAVDAASTHLGGLDIVINCAGIMLPATLPDTTNALWQQTIAVNLSGTFYMTREATPHMQRGAIINVASDAGLHGIAGYAAYCATKAAVIGLTKALARELAPAIRVTAVAPGPIDTPGLHTEFNSFPDPKTERDKTKQHIPLQRFGTPNDVATAILYLATAKNITGTILNLDGGLTA